MTHSILIVVVVAAVSFLIKELAFIVFGGKRQLPKLISYLSEVLPYSVIGMLVIYCFRNVNILGGSHGAPELIACVLVAVLHLWRKNTLLSVAAGTLTYMFLVQYIFI